jgi:prepilin-type N-terminal cleavage/methylation domain-containing protein
MKNKKAFTLIEILVVISIIIIASSVALVSIRGSREAAREAKIRAERSENMIAIELDLMASGGYENIQNIVNNYYPEANISDYNEENQSFCFDYDGWCTDANDTIKGFCLVDDGVCSPEDPEDPEFIEPSVATLNASMSGTTGYLAGDLTSLGDAGTVDVYFQWSEPGLAWNETTPASKSETGTFTAEITIDEFQDYNYRAVVKYNDGEVKYVYGDTLGFWMVR